MGRQTGRLGDLAVSRVGSGSCFVLAATTATLMGLVGCTQQLTIRQTEHINTAVHWSRSPDDRTGEPRPGGQSQAAHSHAGR